MNNKIKIIIGILLYLTMPILMAYIIVSLYVKNEGTILAIIFFSIVALGIAASVNKFIKCTKNDKKNKEKK